MSDANVKQYRKKPVVIEALQLRWDTWSQMCDFVDVGKLSDGKPEGFNPDGDSNVIGLHIPTLEGLMVASEGDYIIKGVNGEFYPCKPDIFAKTYDDATTPTTAGEPVAPVASVLTRFGADKARWFAELEQAAHAMAEHIVKLESTTPAAADQRARDDGSAYAITLQRMIEAHCRGERVDESGSPHLGAMLNAYHDQRARGTVDEAMVCDKWVKVVVALEGIGARLFEKADVRKVRDTITAALHADAARTGSRAGREELDAERYRWLREQLHGADFDYETAEGRISVLTFRVSDYLRVSADLDATIDAAREGVKDGD